MIVVKVKAGLGNQMFQYALGRRLSLDWQDKLKFDFSWFDEVRKGETPREIEIGAFNIVFDKANVSEVSSVKPNPIRKILERINGRFNRNYFFTFHPHLLKRRKDILLDGYFQSYKYLNPIREKLLNDFVLKNGYGVEAEGLKKEIEESEQSVAIHVRRGDYVTSCKDWNGLCSVDYYRKAIAEINKKHSNIKLFIFSDDIQWAKENFKFDVPMVFVSRPTLGAVEELLLMSLCKHQIIANSTFSWWSAWLNKNNEKIVIAPSRWLVASKIDTKDLIPSDWIRI